ncbi:hypothetical protein TI39_contig367g00008 [Zymoseptoria brevis]|uniref:Uncharacterized protein n=1 Tax=Zymoseptoria brevis TaxID=1047168 RepID=A0A0F4GSR2_9PEZI|nr:hypothetical protein TI39_contig367g00008 [Zymoseptoria brevis]
MTSISKTPSIIDPRNDPEFSNNRTSIDNTRRPQSVEIRRKPVPVPAAATLFGPQNDPYSESVATWNIDHHTPPSTVRLVAPEPESRSPAVDDTRRSIDAHTRHFETSPESEPRRSLTHKRSLEDLRSVAGSSPSPEPADSHHTGSMGFLRRALSRGREKRHSRKISEADQKALPEVPRVSRDEKHAYTNGNTNDLPLRGHAADQQYQPKEYTLDAKADPPIRPRATEQEQNHQPRDPAPTSPTDSPTPDALGPEFAHLADPSAPEQLNTLARLPSEIDISNTVDTTPHTSYAPAVVHEVVQPKVHEIVTQEITREIHNHDVYHRVLPVLEFEVLPARHYVQVPGADGKLGLRELSVEEIPGGRAVAEGLNRAIADAVRNFDPRAAVVFPHPPTTTTSSRRDKTRAPPSAPIIPAVFTARRFEGTDGDTKEWTDDELGIQRSEQTWVHAPTLERDREWVIDGTKGERGVEMHFWHQGTSPEHGNVGGREGLAGEQVVIGGGVGKSTDPLREGAKLSGTEPVVGSVFEPGKVVNRRGRGEEVEHAVPNGGEKEEGLHGVVVVGREELPMRTHGKNGSLEVGVGTAI